MDCLRSRCRPEKAGRHRRAHGIGLLGKFGIAIGGVGLALVSGNEMVESLLCHGGSLRKSSGKSRSRQDEERKCFDRLPL